MRLLFLFLIIISFSTAYAENKLVIVDSVTSSATVKPDIMYSGVSISSKQKSFDAVSKSMEIYADIVKQHDICTYSSYSISPEYRYTNNVRTLAGYSGYMNVPCQFADISAYNGFLNAVHSSGAVFSMSPVSWKVKDSTVSKVTDKLKSDIISLAEAKESAYSSSTERNCRLITINYNNQPVNPVPAPKLMRTESFSVSAPDVVDSNLSVTALVKFVCK